MTTQSLIAVVAAVITPALLYFYLAWKANASINGLGSFFPLSKFVSGDEFGRSTASAGVSLATVILALVNLAPFLGIGLLVTIASYVASFVLLYWCTSTILSANPENDTIQTFLAKSYGSLSLEKVAVGFSFIGLISVFAMELLVGVTVLEPFMGESVFAFSGLYLLFIVGYSVVGGFRAIVATEQWQIRFIVAAVFALLAVIPLTIYQSTNTVSLTNIVGKVAGSWNASWTFCVGIIALNFPAALSDSATWQRLCATKSEDDARHGIRRAIPIFILIWGSLILGACVLSQVAQASGAFDPAKGSLMSFVVTILSTGGYV